MQKDTNIHTVNKKNGEFGPDHTELNSFIRHLVDVMNVATHTIVLYWNYCYHWSANHLRLKTKNYTIQCGILPSMTKKKTHERFEYCAHHSLNVERKLKNWTNTATTTSTVVCNLELWSNRQQKKLYEITRMRRIDVFVYRVWLRDVH